MQGGALETSWSAAEREGEGPGSCTYSNFQAKSTLFSILPTAALSGICVKIKTCLCRVSSLETISLKSFVLLSYSTAALVPICVPNPHFIPSVFVLTYFLTQILKIGLLRFWDYIADKDNKASVSCLTCFPSPHFISLAFAPCVGCIYVEFRQTIYLFVFQDQFSTFVLHFN